MGKKRFSNDDISGFLFEIAEMLDMLGINSFRSSAYRRAARSIETMPVDINEVYKKKGLEGIAGVGAGIAEKIEELLKTGRSSYRDGLKKRLPVEVSVLMKVPGLGPKKIRKLNDALKIKSVKDLRDAAKKHKISKIPGFGLESERDILDSIELMKLSKGRISLKEAEKIANRVISKIKKLNEVKKISVAGSLLRKRPTIGDIDIIVSSKKPGPIIDKFCTMRDVKKVFGKGSTKASVVLDSGVQVDLRVLPPESWGAGLFYFTGSKDYSIRTRKIAIKKGYKLNEYGLFDKKTGKMIAGKSEREITKRLGLKWIKPEDRIK